MTVASHGTVSDASSANMAQGVCPPLTAKWKLPLAATAARARSATNAAPARATAPGSARVWSSWCIPLPNVFVQGMGSEPGPVLAFDLRAVALPASALAVTSAAMVPAKPDDPSDTLRQPRTQAIRGLAVVRGGWSGGGRWAFAEGCRVGLGGSGCMN